MKISAMKKGLLVLIASVCFLTTEAQFNYGYKNDNVPVVGRQYGLVGGGHSAGIYNRDDMESPLLDPQIMNFTYFAGVERVRWYNPWFGVGQQFLYWNAGAKYTGRFDTTDNAPTINATTKLTYAKMPILFWFKSYNRYNPERRLRVNTFFGPYIALLMDAQEDFRVTIPNSDPVSFIDYSFNASGLRGINQDGNEIGSSSLINGGAINNVIDWGFTMGAGVEMRLWRKTVISLMLRTDLGVPDIENKGARVNNIATGTEYGFYEDVTAKYIQLSPVVGPTFEQNRPVSRNFSFGAQLSVRKYFGVD